jgi:uroporphyrinogen III methyltransferase/synthase
LVDRLAAAGAAAVAVPTIGIAPPAPGGPLDRALKQLDTYDWVIVTSANGARACVARAVALGLDLRSARPQWAAIGPATAAALREAGIAVAATPSRYLAEAIPEALPDVSGARVLLPRTDAAPRALADALRARGADVDEVTAYRTILAPARSRARLHRLITGREIDAVVFTSASTVHGMVRLLGEARDALRQIEIACIGPVTAAAVIEEGFQPAVVASEHTSDGIVAALITHSTAGTEGEPHARDRAPR